MPEINIKYYLFLVVPEVDMDPATPTNDLIDVRVQLDRERRLRMVLEDQVRNLESQLYPERIREITQQVQLQYQHRDDVSYPLLAPNIV